MAPLTILQSVFGYSTFRPPQEDIINTVLSGHDAFVLMPTGGGKSLCYQIPALIFEGVTIVVSPLIALMKDQVDALRVLGVEAAFLNSSQTPDERADILERLEDGHIKLLYVSPERLLGTSDGLLSLLRRIKISLFAVDEAHCISQWGHDFRPEYAQMAILKQQFRGIPTLALTATADALTRDDIIQKLGLINPTAFVSSFNRPNIKYVIEPKRGMYERLLAYLKTHRDDAGIVYVLARDRAETLAAKLAADGFKAKPYHAGLPSTTRQRTHEQFLRDQVQIVVATIAFGMGINKPNVRFVIHADLPKNIEGYYQETGRAGRDGLPSDAILYYSSGDVTKLASFAEIDGNAEQSFILKEKLKKMAALCESATCRRRSILTYFGESAPLQCDNCDICISPRELFDATILSQKALSAVARLESRFGMSYVIDILRGSQSEKIASHHKALPTFGVGRDTSQNAWRHYIRQLIERGFLAQTPGKYPLLTLTSRSRSVLANLEKVELSKLPSSHETNAKTVLSDIPYEQDLFNELKILRRTIAEQENVPPYIIFSDVTIREMSTYLPQSLDEIRKINGVGDLKCTRYGTQFLTMIKKYCEERGLASKINEKQMGRTRTPKTELDSDTKAQTLKLFQSGKSIEYIARQRNLATTTIENHLGFYIASGILKVTDIVNSEKLAIIEQTIRSKGTYPLSNLKEILGQTYSYSEIKAVIAHLEHEKAKTR